MKRVVSGMAAIALALGTLAGVVRSNEAPDVQTAANQALVEGLQRYRDGTARAYHEAIAKWREAVELFDRSNNGTMAANVLTNIATAQLQLGDLDDALESYQTALPLLEAAGDPHAVAQTLTQLAEVRSLRGEYQTALDTYRRALPLWEETGYQTGTAETFNDLGYVYRELGDPQNAIALYTDALTLVETLGNSANIAATLNNLGGAYLDANEFDRALEFYTRALETWKAIDDRAGAASTFNNLGYLYSRQNDIEKALRAFAQAVDIWGEIHNSRAEASTLNNIGDVYFQVGNLDTALDFYTRALPLREDTGDRPGIARTRYSIARVYRQRGNLELARTEIELALDIIEDLRTNVIEETLRATFFATQQDYYEFYIDLLMQMHRRSPEAGFDAIAFHAKERASARSLLDLLNSSGGDIEQGIDPELRDRLEEAQAQLHLLERQRIEVFSREHTDAEAAELDAAFEAAIAEIRDVQARIRAANPRYADLTQPQPVTLGDVQNKLLDTNTTLLIYALGNERSYLWSVTPNDFHSYELPPRADIEAAANWFLETIYVPRYRNRPQVVAEAAARLSRTILPPESDRLASTRLAIVGDGVLQYVPFAALTRGDNRLLLQDFEIVHLPSASTLAALRRNRKIHRPPSKTLAVFADPIFSPDDERLPNTIAAVELPPELDRSARQSEVRFNRLSFTGEEAERISRWVPESMRLQALGFEANRQVMMTTPLDDYRIVHFATHGLANSVTPELSGLVLSLIDRNGRPQNGFLRLYDIFNLDLYAELVVLSACNTGRGREIRGEGIVGLTRGFMYAGSDRVLVSFWAVDDAGTAELMERFYRQMLQNQRSPAAALREAQLDLMRSPRWNSPYYWSAFAVQGDWN
ncbi:hypothetical protein AY599_20855 [Leptolyngbya valderiana BDU 20041]|nr:hypothetical protein AY599_20855 [Leptolyngbya valderiana BDU 20041]